MTESCADKKTSLSSWATRGTTTKMIRATMRRIRNGSKTLCDYNDG